MARVVMLNDIAAYHRDWVNRSNGKQRNGRPAKAYSTINTNNGEVPVRFCTTIGTDSQSDKWLIDKKHASALSKMVKDLAKVIIKRRNGTWGKIDAQISDVGDKPAQRGATSAVRSSGWGRQHALTPKWSAADAKLAVAAFLSRGGVRVAQPFVPSDIADLYAMHAEGGELLPLRLYVRAAQAGEPSRSISARRAIHPSMGSGWLPVRDRCESGLTRLVGRPVLRRDGLRLCRVPLHVQ